MSAMKEFTKGFIKENPVFIMALGLCPTLAVSTSVQNAIGMGLAATFVLVFSNILISLIKDFIPSKIHIPAYIVVIASFVTIVDMVMHAFLPPLHKSLGLFIPLIVVNCIILGRAEAFASKNTVRDSAVDAIAMGIGFAVGLVAIALVREVLGAGTITIFPDGGVIRIPGLADKPALVFAFPAGALIVVGFLQAFFRWLGEVTNK